MKVLRWLILDAVETVLVFAFVALMFWLGSEKGLGRLGWILILCCCASVLVFLAWRIIVRRKKVAEKS
jgi:hypothetical protein